MRKYWIEHLRVIAIVAVVNIHVSYDFYAKFGNIKPLDWWIANIFNSVSRFSVPLFIMISGAVLLGKNYNLKDFYKTRALRLIPPLIFWSLFYVALRVYTGESIITIIKGGILSGNFFGHLWYLTMFICLMVFVPFINFFIVGRKPDEKEIKFLLFLFICFFCLDWLSDAAMEIKSYNVTWLSGFPLFIGYFLSGYFIYVYYDKIKISNILAITGILLLTTLGVMLNYVSCSHGIIKDYFILSNCGPIVYIITVLIFYLLRNNFLYFLENRVIGSISEASFGIYLLHPFFVLFAKSKFPSYYDNGFFYIPLTIIFSLVLSYLVITLFRKITFGKYVC